MVRIRLPSPMPILAAAILVLASLAAAIPARADHRVALAGASVRGTIHDVVAREIVIDTVDGSVIVPLADVTINGRPPKGPLTPGTAVVVALPTPSAPLAFLGTRRALVILPHGPVALPIAALPEQKVEVAWGEGGDIELSLRTAAEMTAHGVVVPPTSPFRADSLPEHTVYALVVGQSQGRFLLETAEQQGLGLYWLPTSRAPGLAKQMGRLVVLTAMPAGVRVQPWPVGVNARVAFGGIVRKVTSTEVYLATRAGTAVVPRQGSAFQVPASSRAQWGPVEGVPVTPGAWPAPDPESDASAFPASSPVDPASILLAFPSDGDDGFLLPGFGAVPYPEAVYDGSDPYYDPSYGGYPGYVGDGIVYDPSAYVPAPSVALAVGSFVFTVLPAWDYAPVGVCGSLAAISGPQGDCYTVPCSALPPCYATTPVLVPAPDGQYLPVPLAAVLGVQLGGGAALTVAAGDAAFAPMPVTLLADPAWPAGVALAPTLVSLPNGDVVQAPFSQAVRMVQVRNALIVDAPEFPVDVATVPASVALAGGREVSMPLAAALRLSQAQRFSLVDPVTLPDSAENPRVLVRLRNGATREVPLSRALALAHAQGAMVTDDPRLPASLGDRRVRIRLANGATSRISLQNALRLQQVAASLPSRNRFLVASTSRLPMQVSLPNGRTVAVPVRTALRLQHIGGGRMLGPAAPIATISRARRGEERIVVGHVGESVLIRQRQDGRSRIVALPARALQGSTPHAGEAVRVRPATSGRYVLRPDPSLALVRGSGARPRADGLRSSRVVGVSPPLRPGGRSAASQAYVDMRRARPGRSPMARQASPPPSPSARPATGSWDPRGAGTAFHGRHSAATATPARRAFWPTTAFQSGHVPVPGGTVTSASRAPSPGSSTRAGKPGRGSEGPRQGQTSARAIPSHPVSGSAAVPAHPTAIAPWQSHGQPALPAWTASPPRVTSHQHAPPPQARAVSPATSAPSAARYPSHAPRVSAPPVVHYQPRASRVSAPPVVHYQPRAPRVSAPPVVHYQPRAPRVSAPSVVHYQPRAPRVMAPPVVHYQPQAPRVMPPPVVHYQPRAPRVSAPPVVHYQPQAPRVMPPPVVHYQPQAPRVMAPPVVHYQPQAPRVMAPPVVHYQPQAPRVMAPPAGPRPSAAPGAASPSLHVHLPR